jgi:hypothetical protein
MTRTWPAEHPGALRLFAAILPVVLGAGLSLAHDTISAATGALVLVLAVVAAAATGDRLAGGIAAISAAASFDFFLTVPYHSLAIKNRDDAVLNVILLLVGLSVTEIALWGRRQQTSALRREGYLDGLVHLLELPSQTTTDERGRAIAAAITHVLGADRTEWVTGEPGATDAILDRDAEVHAGSTILPVSRVGLPTESYTAIVLHHPFGPPGYFRVTASTHLVRPGREQLKVAVLLAEQMVGVTTHD